MSEDYPMLAQYLRRHRAKAERDAKKLLRGPSNHAGLDVWNEHTRHTMLKHAQVICVNGTVAD